MEAEGGLGGRMRQKSPSQAKSINNTPLSNVFCKIFFSLKNVCIQAFTQMWCRGHSSHLSPAPDSYKILKRIIEM